MSLGILIAAVLILAVVASAFLGKKARNAKEPGWPVFAVPVLSGPEQILYHRLLKAFPDLRVLPQVSLAQFVKVKKGAPYQSVYNRFNHLRADFVICRPDFSALAVLELDDRSHDHPKRQDADRRKAEVLRAAGIPLHRLNVNPMPDEAELRGLLTN